MGIQGLLPLLKSIQKPTHLRNFAGQTLGVDAYGWLHRGTAACVIELALQKPTRKHIDFALSRVRMLLYFGVKPYLVFDGDYLPSKAHTEKDRAARRKESKQAGLELLRMGRVAHAHLELQKAVDVTPAMARELIEELKLLNVPYIVAPYEADSQLAYLEKKGEISGVISEDSDLLVFGVRRLLTKLDQYGDCVLISRSDFTACREVSLVGWSDQEFRMMTMLSGCDYLPRINSMGLKTAYRHVRKHKTLERIVQMIQFEGKKQVPADYIEAFTRAERTFLYQWVFCPQARTLVNLNPVPSDLDVEEMSYLGQPVEANIAKGVAAGDLDPNTKQRIIIAITHASGTARTTSPDVKQGKPITDFFKARRTPLSELDPNSFTPSPRQQRLLQEQRPTSWSASQAPTARVSILDRVTSQNTPASVPQARRTVSEQGSNGHHTSPKRQRLCSDIMLARSMTGSLLSTTSPFFSQSIAEPKPSLRKTFSQKRDEGFEVWSDDFVVDAVPDLPAVQDAAPDLQTQVPRKRKKLAVYADVEPDERLEQPPAASADLSHGIVTAKTTTSAQSPAKTPPTLPDSPECQSQRSVFSKGINHDFTSLNSRFMHKPAISGNGTKRTKSAPLPSRVSLQDTKRDSQLEQMARLAEPDDLAIQVGNDPDPDTVVPCSSPIVKPYDAASHGAIEDEEWPALDQRRGSPDAQVLVMGSEDLLVPNSPGDEGDDGGLRPKLDLGRFAFAG